MTITPPAPPVKHPVRSTSPAGQRDRRMLYLTGCTNPLTTLAAQHYPTLGMLAQPGNALHLQGQHYQHWAIDNGVFGVALAAYHGRRGPWCDDDTEEYLDYLARVCREVDTSRVLFATAPDVLEFREGPDGRPVPFGDAEATWEVSRKVFARIRALGLPAALVAQDGIKDEHPTRQRHWDQFDALFLGGSDHFKLGREAECIAGTAWTFGKWVHMGRVSSAKRMVWARRIGCDSADGTFIGFGPRRNLPQVLGWLDLVNGEPWCSHSASWGRCGCKTPRSVHVPLETLGAPLAA